MTYPSFHLCRVLAGCFLLGKIGWTMQGKSNSRLQKYALSRQNHFYQKAS